MSTSTPSPGAVGTWKSTAVPPVSGRVPRMAVGDRGNGSGLELERPALASIRGGDVDPGGEHDAEPDGMVRRHRHVRCADAISAMAMASVMPVRLDVGLRDVQGPLLSSQKA